jgi:uncharacterized phage-associated protein
MSYCAAQIANEFLRRGKRDSVSVDPLKLQKLVYLAHGWNLAFRGIPLIKDRIEAWRHGPVVPSLYREFRKFGVSPIDTEAVEPEDVEPIDEKSLSLIDEVWKTYGRKSGIDLSMITHEPGYAWDLVRRINPNDWNSPVIPVEFIRDEFDRRKSVA